MPTSITTLATMTPLGSAINPYYIEGTYNPVVTAPGGTPPTFATVVTSVTTIGRLCLVTVDADNKLGGTAGAGAVQMFVTLPFPASGMQGDALLSIGTALNGTALEAMYGRIILPSTLALYRLDLVGGVPRIVAFNASELSDANVRQLEFQVWYNI